MMSTVVHRPLRLLTIAGSDSGGGAGLQADLKTFSALGAYGMTVVTALTAQNTQAVRAIHEVPPAFIAEQIDAVFEDIGVDAVKIGMLASTSIIETVAERLRRYRPPIIVLDPVMVAASGGRLLREDAIRSLVESLFPIATVITPNLHEAEVLIGSRIDHRHDMEPAAFRLLQLGAPAVVLKGGHLRDADCPDLLVWGDPPRVQWFEGSRVVTANVHGTGCTMASAIAVWLAKGADLPTAVKNAKAYLAEALRASSVWRLGNGHGPVHHFHHWWR